MFSSSFNSSTKTVVTEHIQIKLKRKENWNMYRPVFKALWLTVCLSRQTSQFYKIFIFLCKCCFLYNKMTVKIKQVKSCWNKTKLVKMFTSCFLNQSLSVSKYFESLNHLKTLSYSGFDQFTLIVCFCLAIHSIT